MFKNNLLLLKYLITKIRRVHHEYETQNFTKIRHMFWRNVIVFMFI